ncbi:MAG: DNA polymerase IV, partial [bacterium]
GKPVCVGGIPGRDRSVVACASYEARRYGVHAGMPLLQAQRLCPLAIFLRARGGAYLEISRRIVDILGDFTDRVEPSSIDESFLDISGALQYFGGPEKIGRLMKERIRADLHLTCTVGIGPTRIIAKMATALGKPDGLKTITREAIQEVIYPLPVEEVPGIGARLQKALNGLGIMNIRQLANAPEKLLFTRFGVNGPRLQKIVRGELDWEVVTEDERPDEKSVGNSRTFEADTAELDDLQSYLLTLVQMVCRRLREGDFAGRTVTLTIRYSDFHTVTHRKSSRRSSNDENDLFKIAWGLFQQYYITGFPVRLLGISVSNLSPRSSRQLDLFDRESQLYPAIDALRAKFGEGILRRGSTLNIYLRRHTRNLNFVKPQSHANRKA